MSELMHRQITRAATSLGWAASEANLDVFATKRTGGIPGAQEARLLLGYEGRRVRLTGECIIDGVNVLSHLTGYVPTNANVTDINLAVSGFIGVVHATLDDVKMSRIHHAKLISPHGLAFH